MNEQGNFHEDSTEDTASIFEQEQEDDKAELGELTKGLLKRLSELQQEIKQKKIPVIIIFEAWGGSGKGAIIGKLISELDPRGFLVYTTGAQTADEKRYPPMRRFWTKLPEYGKVSIFDRSWYRDVSISLVEDGISGKETERRFADIIDFEKQLSDDGYLIVKFFLDISKKEQKKRFEALEENPSTRWRVTDDDWRHHRMYAQYSEAFCDMIRRTDRLWAPWIEIDAKKRKKAVWSICNHLVNAIETALSRQISPAAAEIRIDSHIRTLPVHSLSEYDLSAKMEEDAYKTELKAAQSRLFELHNILYQRKIPLIIVYEGWDAAGKGGNIKRLTEGLDPRGYAVTPIAAPTPQEKNRQYLWRFWNTLPKDGHIGIYDRSWYGRVMVERIEGFCTEAQWKRAFDEINHFELNLKEWGAVILKLWLHIDKQEQLQRFNERENTLSKQWKITPEDWRNREKWDQYEQAVNDMLYYTNTDYAPWIVIESNDKKYARVKALKSAIYEIERGI